MRVICGGLAPHTCGPCAWRRRWRAIDMPNCRRSSWPVTSTPTIQAPIILRQLPRPVFQLALIQNSVTPCHNQ